MSLQNILLYCLRAGAFAACACAVYWVVCRMKTRRPGVLRLLAVAYLAALVQITVLRGGVNWQNLLSGSRDVRMIPFLTTVQLLRGGAWPLIYNVVGNLAWFVPLGCILRRKSGLTVLLAGAGLSLCIEIAQFLLMTGISDIDDIIFNALGALLGWILCRIYKKKCG